MVLRGRGHSHSKTIKHPSSETHTPSPPTQHLLCLLPLLLNPPHRAQNFPTQLFAMNPGGIIKPGMRRWCLSGYYSGKKNVPGHIEQSWRLQPLVRTRSRRITRILSLHLWKISCRIFLNRAALCMWASNSPSLVGHANRVLHRRGND